MAVTRLTVRTPTEIRNSFLRTYRLGLLDRGVANPNVTKGSEIYVLASAIADELSVGEANAIVKADASMPDTAQEDDLIEGAAQFGISRRDAVGSLGPIVMDSSAASPIASGTQLLDDQGNRYEITTPGTYADGSLVQIQSLDTGVASNLAEDTVLRWVVAPPFSAPTALVGPGGLRDGYDEETLEELRARWLARIQTPPAGGNAQDIAETAENASPSVQKAFVYAALYGPGTVHVACAGRPTSTNKSRTISASIITSTVKPIVAQRYPGQAYIVATTVTGVNTDLKIGLSLPSASSASPPGPGGGWLDGSPFPRTPLTTTTDYGTVTSFTSTTVFRVRSLNGPTAGVTRVAHLSQTTWTLDKATITASTYIGSDIYEITIDQPLVGIAVGDYMFPQCLNQDVYASTALESFSLMGPAELTSNASALERASRFPVPNTSWPYSIDAEFTRRLQDVGSEVQRATILESTIAGSAGVFTPAVPGGFESAPNICIPRYIGFYPA